MKQKRGQDNGKDCFYEDEHERRQRKYEKTKYGLKWFVTVIASILLLVSTFYRLTQGLEADKTLSFIFAFVAGLPWGANIIDYLKHK